jgi:hypothetical protein
VDTQRHRARQLLDQRGHRGHTDDHAGGGRADRATLRDNCDVDRAGHDPIHRGRVHALCHLADLSISLRAGGDDDGHGSSIQGGLHGQRDRVGHLWRRRRWYDGDARDRPGRWRVCRHTDRDHHGPVRRHAPVHDRWHGSHDERSDHRVRWHTRRQPVAGDQGARVGRGSRPECGAARGLPRHGRDCRGWRSLRCAEGRWHGVGVGPEPLGTGWRRVHHHSADARAGVHGGHRPLDGTAPHPRREGRWHRLGVGERRERPSRQRQHVVVSTDTDAGHRIDEHRRRRGGRYAFPRAP